MKRALSCLLLLVASVSGFADRSYPLAADGSKVNPLETDADYVVLLFLAVECPISNRFAPEVNRIVKKFSSDEVAFWAVYTNDQKTVKEIATHQKDYAYEIPALRDYGGFLVEASGAFVTPEVSVYDTKAKAWVYRGRINNQYIDFGKWRKKATKHDLMDTLTAIGNGASIEPRRTRAVGCYIVIEGLNTIPNS